jgi:hypothetical protein
VTRGPPCGGFGPDLPSERRATWALRGWYRSGGTVPTRAAGRSTGSSEEPKAFCDGSGGGLLPLTKPESTAAERRFPAAAGRACLWNRSWLSLHCHVSARDAAQRGLREREDTRPSAYRNDARTREDADCFHFGKREFEISSESTLTLRVLTNFDASRNAIPPTARSPITPATW